MRKKSIYYAFKKYQSWIHSITLFRGSDLKSFYILLCQNISEWHGFCFFFSPFPKKHDIYMLKNNFGFHIFHHFLSIVRVAGLEKYKSNMTHHTEATQNQQTTHLLNSNAAQLDSLNSTVFQNRKSWQDRALTHLSSVPVSI